MESTPQRRRRWLSAPLKSISNALCVVVVVDLNASSFCANSVQTNKQMEREKVGEQMILAGIFGTLTHELTHVVCVHSCTFTTGSIRCTFQLLSTGKKEREREHKNEERKKNALALFRPDNARTSPESVIAVDGVSQCTHTHKHTYFIWSSSSS